MRWGGGHSAFKKKVKGGEDSPFNSLDSVELLRHGEGAWSKGMIISCFLD